MSLCVAKEIVRGDCWKSVLWESRSGMKKTKSKRNGSSVYDRTARHQCSRARFQPGFVSYHTEVRPQVNILSTFWNLTLEGWFQASLVYVLEASKNQGHEGWPRGANATTETGENKWIFERVKNGWLGKCPHVVRKWPSRAGLAPIWRDERPGVTDHHPPLLGCSCHSRQKLASNSASVARISAVIQQLGLHWASLALCETTAACVASTVSLSSPITHQETIMNNRATF